MDTALLIRKFEDIGARVRLNAPLPRWRSLGGPLSLDISHDDKGELFDLRFNESLLDRLDAVDVRPQQRHLLLLAVTRPPLVRQLRWSTARSRHVERDVPGAVEKAKFLCGHDERHWFVAAVPEDAGASNVRTAMEALKPAPVLDAQARAGLPFRHRFERRNRAFVRQGEWFFLPRPELLPPSALVRNNEPLQRSGGKAHWAQFGFRLGGETVYVNPDYPRGLIEREYRDLIARRPQLRGQFRIMQRNATLFVKGRVSHPDHATITLHCWHEVVMNTENRARARQNVVFLD